MAADDDKEIHDRYRDWLMSLPRDQMRRVVDAHTAHLANGTYTVTITPELFQELRHVTMLNRRMLDRSPEHTTIDKLLTKFVRVCKEQSDSTLNEKWPADLPKPPDTANPYIRKQEK